MGMIVEKFKKFWKRLGPGLIAGAADDDPSGIATYSQTGAGFGFKYLWLSAWTFPLLGVIQETCARIALVTGRGLAENIKRHFSKKILYFVGGIVVFANTLNIGADLGGMADAVKIFFPGLSLWVPIIMIALLSALLEVLVSYRVYAKYLKWLALTILAYVLAATLLQFDVFELFSTTFIPSISFDRESILIIAAVLGTTISPYLFFWQSSEEVEEEINEGGTTIKKRVKQGPSEIKKMRFDVWMGMFFSNLVMFCIIAVCASTLYPIGITDITSGAEAALALKPLAGDFAFVLFAFGILSTGLLAIPVLAGSSAYVISEIFGWKEGLYRKPREARAFYIVIVLSILFGLTFNLLGINPIKALIYTSIANAIVTPLALVFVVILASRKSIMGEHRNGILSNILGWGTVLIMGAVGMTVFVQIF